MAKDRSKDQESTMDHKHEYDPTTGRCDCGASRCKCRGRAYHQRDCVTMQTAREYARQSHDPYVGAWAGLKPQETDPWIDARYQ